MPNLFLTPDETAELTGIRRGRGGKTRDQMQADWLRTSGIAFVVNAAGRPIITVAAVEGRKGPPPPAVGWQHKAIVV